MTFREQLLAGAIGAPASIVRARRATLAYAALYLLLCSSLLGAVAWAVIHYSGDLREVVLGYLFPDSWHFAVGYVVDEFFAQQQRTVLINGIASASLMAVTLLLFPIKEMVSAAFEREADLVGLRAEEFPLWMQAWEEIKLFLLWLAVQMGIFWIDYHPGAAREWIAVAVSYLWLCFTFAIDFISPVFQRHKGRYSRILKTLAAQPVASLSFGAFFALPAIAAGWLWRANPEWSTGTAVIAIFAAEVVAISWAAIAGTWLGARMFPDFQRRTMSHGAVRAAVWALVLAVVAFNGYRFGAVGLAVHHKSQILKCDYGLVPSSFSFERPSLAGLLSGEVDVGLSFEVRIHNPTQFDVELEENRIVIANDGVEVARSQISPIRVPAGEEVRAPVHLTVKVERSLLTMLVAKRFDLLSLDDWTVTLYLQVGPGFELPVYLKTKG